MSDGRSMTSGSLGNHGLSFTLVATVSGGFSAWVIARAAHAVSGNKLAPWIVGRAAGITAYVLLVLLVLMGLLLSHPWRARFSRPSAATRIRIHIALAIFTLCFMALHVVVLATDKYAGVGWVGVFVPMGASYRPVYTTFGLLGMWFGLLIGLSAAAAGRLPRRLWWPIHKVALTSFVLIWLHGVLGGSDTRHFLALYLVSGLLVVALALSRYSAKTPADRIAELSA